MEVPLLVRGQYVPWLVWWDVETGAECIPCVAAIEGAPVVVVEGVWEGEVEVEEVVQEGGDVDPGVITGLTPCAIQGFVTLIVSFSLNHIFATLSLTWFS